MRRSGRAKSPLSVKYIVSACLAGISCTYRGKNKLRHQIKRLVDKGDAIALCPEVLGGLPVPRENSEIIGGDGKDVLAKKAKVMTASGIDVSKNYISGSRIILAIAKRLRINKAILKANSPACGCGLIYDGTFRRKLKKGSGVLAALLAGHGVRIINERQYSGAK